jgi:hypothetical protein
VRRWWILGKTSGDTNEQQNNQIKLHSRPKTELFVTLKMVKSSSVLAEERNQFRANSFPAIAM